MNRSKFRLWDADNRRMVVSFDINVIVEYISISDSYINTLGLDDKVYLGKNSTLMQWSGLRDANGKDIFEGDIVRYITPEDGPSQFLYKICFGKYTNYFFDYDLGFYGIDTHDTITRLGNSNKEFEVVGNVYENSELMVFSAPYEPMIDNI